MQLNQVLDAHLLQGVHVGVEVRQRFSAGDELVGHFVDVVADVVDFRNRLLRVGGQGNRRRIFQRVGGLRPQAGCCHILLFAGRHRVVSRAPAGEAHVGHCIAELDGERAIVEVFADGVRPFGFHLLAGFGVDGVGAVAVRPVLLGVDGVRIFRAPRRAVGAFLGVHGVNQARSRFHVLAVGGDDGGHAVAVAHAVVVRIEHAAAIHARRPLHGDEIRIGVLFLHLRQALLPVVRQTLPRAREVSVQVRVSGIGERAVFVRIHVLHQTLGVPLRHRFQICLVFFGVLAVADLAGFGVHIPAIGDAERGHEQQQSARAGVEGNFILFAVAVRVAFLERGQHVVPLVDGRRRFHAHVLQPVLAHHQAPPRDGRLFEVSHQRVDGREVQVAAFVIHQRLGDLRIFLQQLLVVGHVLVDDIVQLDDDAVGVHLRHAADVAQTVVVLPLDDIRVVAGCHHRHILRLDFVAIAAHDRPVDVNARHLLNLLETNEGFVEIRFVLCRAAADVVRHGGVLRQCGSGECQQHRQREQGRQELLHGETSFFIGITVCSTACAIETDGNGKPVG